MLYEEGEKEELGTLLVKIFGREKKGEIGYQWKKAYQEVIESQLPFFRQRLNFSKDKG